eukprot:COSAG06_NODE_24524_length_660_cov_0.803922_1_plen_98_part_00
MTSIRLQRAQRAQRSQMRPGRSGGDLLAHHVGRVSEALEVLRKQRVVEMQPQRGALGERHVDAGMDHVTTGEDLQSDAMCQAEDCRLSGNDTHALGS